MFYVKQLYQILCIQDKFSFIQKKDLLRKKCMKELMAHLNGNQEFDGYERYTSRFIYQD
jgi:hypothetical protein